MWAKVELYAKLACTTLAELGFLGVKFQNSLPQSTLYFTVLLMLLASCASHRWRRCCPVTAKQRGEPLIVLCRNQRRKGQKPEWWRCWHFNLVSVLDPSNATEINSLVKGRDGLEIIQTLLILTGLCIFCR